MSVNYSWIGPTKEWLGPLYLGVARNQEISAFTNHIPLFFIKPVSLKGNQPWIHFGRTDVEAEAPIIWPPDGEELTHLKRPWCWERLRARGEGDDRGWDGWMTSLTQWTWVWVDSGSWWWIGRPGMLRFMGSKELDMDWETELKLNSSIEVLTPCTSEWTLFGDKAFKKILKVKWGYMVHA